MSKLPDSWWLFLPMWLFIPAQVLIGVLDEVSGWSLLTFVLRVIYGALTLLFGIGVHRNGMNWEQAIRWLVVGTLAFGLPVLIVVVIIFRKVILPS